MLGRCLFILSLLLGMTTAAQPTWRFPISFEDATGARDTIWMVYDVSATVGSLTDPIVDVDLGEGRVDMEPGVFNVWTYNWEDDSTKTIAWPYTQFPFHQVVVEGAYHEFPVTIRWDMSLGQEPFLPEEGWPINGGAIYNTYFFFFNNCPGCGYFDIGIVDSIVVEDTSPDVLFPFSFTLGHTSTTEVREHAGKAQVEAWPNPAQGLLFIRGVEGRLKAEIFNSVGTLVDAPAYGQASTGLDVSMLSPGLYSVHLNSATQHYHVTFIKQE